MSVVLSNSIWAHSDWSQLGCHEPNGVNGCLYSPGVSDISTNGVVLHRKKRVQRVDHNLVQQLGFGSMCL
jgi:hypothetical protein